ncbi:MAG: hypothetical protein ABSA75_02575 [Candidatus Bathyarchaeia archaeon]
MPKDLVEKQIRKVWLPDKQKYAYVLWGSPQLADVNSGVLEA